MNEQIRSILAQETTKTSKIRQLYLLGVPRAEIARMVTNGNYGFVVNALRRMNECGDGPNIHPSTAALDYAFNRKFGIEIEAYNCSRERLARELKEAGIEVTVEGYNHTTRPHWKLVTDSSLSGNDTFELLSPILVGETGLRELEKVCWVLDLCDVKVNESCGLHVYIDATGFNMETWRNLALSHKVTTKKRNAERYSDRIELQGFQSCFRLFVKPSQSPLKPNQDAATLLVRNHARNGDKRTRITKQGVKD